MKRAAVFAWVLAAGTAIAQPAPSRSDAERAASEGEAKLVSGDFAGALTAFRRAHDLDPNPAYVFDMAQAYRLLGDCVGAAANYKAFLAAVPSPPNGDQIRAWHTEQEQCARAGTDTVLQQADALDKQGRHTEAAAAFLTAFEMGGDPSTLLRAGDAYDRGRDCPNAATTYRRFLQVATDEAQRARARTSLAAADACAVPPPAKEPPPTPPPGGSASSWQRPVAYAALAVGAASALGASYFAWHAHDLANQRDDALAKCSAQMPCTASSINARLSDLDDRGDRAALLARVGFAVGGAAVVTGVVLLVLHRSEPAEHVAVTPVAGGAMAGATFEF